MTTIEIRTCEELDDLYRANALAFFTQLDDAEILSCLCAMLRRQAPLKQERFFLVGADLMNTYCGLRGWERVEEGKRLVCVRAEDFVDPLPQQRFHLCGQLFRALVDRLRG